MNKCTDCQKYISKNSKRCKICSNREIAKREGRNKKISLALAKDYIKVFCKNCQKELSKKAFYYGYKRCNSCSRKFLFVDKTKHPRYGVKLSQEIKDKISKTEKGKIISQKQRAARSIAWSLDKNPKWQNGKSFEKYGLEFNSSLKEQVRFRDKYNCQLCGCSQVENGKKLDVHHIDYNKKNNSSINLLSLCTTCHRKTNGNRDYWLNYLSKLLILKEQNKL